MNAGAFENFHIISLYTTKQIVSVPSCRAALASKEGKEFYATAVSKYEGGRLHGMVYLCIGHQLGLFANIWEVMPDNSGCSLKCQHFILLTAVPS